MTLICLKPIKNPDFVPDWNDPNLHCSSCDHTYKTRLQYTRHCRQVHGLRAPIKPRKTGVPDLNDMNKYCKVCQYTYRSKGGYRKHCESVHGLVPIKFVNPDAVPDINNPDNYCKTCDKHLSTKYNFKLHLHVMHNAYGELPAVKQCNKQPDINNPDNYCCCCDKTLSSRHNYKQHLLYVHSISQKQAPEKDELLPDEISPKMEVPKASSRVTSNEASTIE
ncbi:hypothetical protein MBANPS3_001443 [Mucor bainieri]